MLMHFNILTLFPEALAPYLDSSILGRAQKAGLITINLVNIRDYATDKHKTVDDTPYGGGAGMILKIEPIAKALGSIAASSRQQAAGRTILLSARGKQFDQRKAEEYSMLDSLTLICGRYEGVDQRVADHLADEEVSVGPYVLAGGELPALTVIEATSRLIPGVLGNKESLTEESFSSSTTYNLPPTPSVEYPQYTKPAEYQGWTVPDVLLSGNHEEIKKWREQHRGATFDT